jgi:hypothetical protein
VQPYDLFGDFLKVRQWMVGVVVSSYKALAQVERAFRAFNTDLDIRPSGTAPKPGSAPTCSCG